MIFDRGPHKTRFGSYVSLIDIGFVFLALSELILSVLERAGYQPNMIRGGKYADFVRYSS